MKPGRMIVALLLLYLVALFVADSLNPTIHSWALLAKALPSLLGLAFVSYAVRYARWHWLLARSGYAVPARWGFTAYLAGFAFTATPGKVGELMRIRYFQPLGVPPSRVIAAFVFERAVDLVCVLILAALAIRQLNLFLFAGGFVLLFLGVVVGFSRYPRLLSGISARLRPRFPALSRMARTLRDGLQGSRDWVTPLDIAVSMICGLAAWGLTDWAFLILLGHLQISVPFPASMAIYPLAMLTGAASMIPGGLGSTEAAIVVLLSLWQVPMPLAVIAALGIRLASFWFAVASGLLAMGTLESLIFRSR